MVEQVVFAVIYIIAVFRNPIILVLARDVAYLPVFISLDKKRLVESICITNSSFYYQPLWMRGPDSRTYKIHNIHYSQNDKPIVYKEDKLDVDSPAVLKIYSDVHWVWTNGRKEEVIKRGHHGEIHVVGPILWYLPEYNNINKEDKHIKIAIFDVLPVKPCNRAAIGVIRNPYVTENMILFVQHIVSVINQINTDIGGSIKLYIKHKRPHSNMHDDKYLDYIQTLIESDALKLVPHEENLFSFLSHCDLTINTVYTSVAYISSYLRRDAVYFDPVDEVLPTYESSPYISFVNNREELLELIKKKIVIHGEPDIHEISNP